MQTPIETMYKAGKDYIPMQAAVVATASNKLYDAMRMINEQAAYAGDPPLLKAMLEIGEACYIDLRNTAASMDGAAHAVVATADDFVRTDATARDDYNHMSPELRDKPIPTHQLDPSINKGDLTTNGALAVDPDSRPGHSGHVPSTPGPSNADDDRHDRDQTEQNDKNDNPLPTQPR